MPLPTPAAAAERMPCLAQGNWKPIVGSGWEDTISEIRSGTIGEDSWTLISSLGVPFWAALGEPAVHDVEFSSPVYGPVLLWVYVMVSQVLLVNVRR